MASILNDLSVAAFSQGAVTTDSGATPLPPLPGDFYCERNNEVVRGVTLSRNGDVNFGQSFVGCEVGKLEKAEISSKIFQKFEEFEPTDAAPALSNEAKAYLGATTLQLRECSPVAAGNNLISFLRKMVHAQINNVSRKKFSIRAQTVLDGFSCQVKAHIYEQDGGSIVELQRRSGDAVAFNRLFLKLSEYLQAPSCPHVVLDGVASLNVSQMTALPPAEAIAPLLDMATYSHDVHLLAEVASVLAVMAMDPMVAEHLRMPCAASALQQLQHESDFSVAFPTSRMLSCF